MSTSIVKELVVDDAGATAIEYGLIVALIALAIIVSLQAVAGESYEMWGHVETEVTTVVGNTLNKPTAD